ncbi:MAG: aminotransferase class I/II-fold pyridoxal phosphate-dependent enzyme [Planctomycetes bacterium]|nr:aminotransferase class I/II-fold pyridoxal phosphate-dependent enzyme [Planctomycetota bacterium]
MVHEFLAGGAGGGNDPIFALNAEAQRRRAAGESILNATLGTLLRDDGSLFVLPSVVRAMNEVPAEVAAAYAPIAGDEPFTRAVRSDLLRASPWIDSSLAVATPGGSGALHLALTTFLERGQAAVVPEFHWGPYATMASHADRRLSTFRMFAADGRFDLESYERGLAACIAEQGRALAILNFPCNNPTGYSLDRDEWRDVASITAEAGRRAPVSLMIDYAYARFAADDREDWLEDVRNELEDALLLVAWSGSKSFLQYGARIGALVAVHRDDEFLRKAHDALSFACRGTWSNCNRRGLLAIAGILGDPAARDRVRGERAEAVATLMERVAAFRTASHGSQLRYPRYEGGFFVSVFSQEAQAVASRLRELGVFVVPMAGAVRVALCSTPVGEVPRLVDALVDTVE